VGRERFSDPDGRTGDRSRRVFPKASATRCRFDLNSGNSLIASLVALISISTCAVRFSRALNQGGGASGGLSNEIYLHSI